jgi:hypothetical protein
MCTNMAPAIKSKARSGLAMQQSSVNPFIRASDRRCFKGIGARNTMITHALFTSALPGARGPFDAQSRR